MANRRSGFTLIELLVVIAIIAILAAILFPVFVGAKNSAQASKCLNNMKQIGTGLIVYCQDWSDRLPTDTGMNDTARFWEYPNCWIVQVAPCIKNTGVWKCPSVFATYHEFTSSDQINGVPTTTSYGLNGLVPGRVVGQMKKPSKTPFLFEWCYAQQYTWTRPFPSDLISSRPYNGGWGANHGGGNLGDKPLGSERKYNVLFCDGHAKLCNPYRLCRLEWVRPY